MYAYPAEGITVFRVDVLNLLVQLNVCGKRRLAR